MDMRTHTRYTGRMPIPFVAANAWERDVCRLCRQHGIEIRWREHAAAGRAYPTERRITIGRVKGPASYAIALHEIGHLLGPRQTSHRLEKEVGAWEWAKAHALVWTDRMDARLHKSLLSYLRWALRRRGNVIKPTDDHVIWTLLDRQTAQEQLTRSSEP